MSRRQLKLCHQPYLRQVVLRLAEKSFRLPSITAVASISKVGFVCECIFICSLVAFEQEPDSATHLPAVFCHCVGSDESNSFEAKLLGNPRAIPEPPVIKGRFSAALPMLLDHCLGAHQQQSIYDLLCVGDRLPLEFSSVRFVRN